MAKLKMNIPDTPNPRAYIPKELTREGFTGDVEILANAKTATLFHPEASLAEIEESLKIVLQDVRLRMGKIGSENQKPV